MDAVAMATGMQRKELGINYLVLVTTQKPRKFHQNPLPCVPNLGWCGYRELLLKFFY